MSEKEIREAACNELTTHADSVLELRWGIKVLGIETESAADRMIALGEHLRDAGEAVKRQHLARGGA